MLYDKQRVKLKIVLVDIQKEKAKGSRIRVLTNPYNLRVIHLDFFRKGGDYETHVVERLTEATENAICQVADETYCDRFW